MGLRNFQEMVFTGRPFTAQDMLRCNFVNSVVPREQLEAEVQKYALACAASRPTDTVMAQKTFFEVFKQQQGEYLGSILSGWLESMMPAISSDGQMELGDDTFERGLANAVKDNDSLYPAEWRLSYGARRGSEKSMDSTQQVEMLRQQLDNLQNQLHRLEEQYDKR